MKSLPRIDLHCHSDASNRAAEVALRAISCPECYSRPIDVLAQATRRGMSFVTLTDHDTIAGAVELRASEPEKTIIGEEVTCWFPEDECKLHLLVWGIDAEHHEQLQRRAKSIYDVADYVESKRIAHAVAHPIYRQNDRLERWHLERLLLLFKGFECLNGAHSPRHREAFEPVLDELAEARIDLLARRHGVRPRWEEPWKKSRTAGSDDHGLLNVGRTWTEFPEGTTTVEKVLECLRTGQCCPGGEAGSSSKLAHTFYSVAVRYYDRHILRGETKIEDEPRRREGAKEDAKPIPISPSRLPSRLRAFAVKSYPQRQPNFTAQLLQMLVGARAEPTKTQKAKLVAKQIARKAWRRVRAPFAPRKDHEGTALLKRLFLDSARRHAKDYPDLYDALRAGLPPLGEHEAMFDFVSSINRDITTGIAAAINQSIDDASFTDLFDSIGAILGQQFVLLPYYFAVFHQNKERHLLAEITGRSGSSIAPMKIGLFTDTFDEINGVARFVRDMGAHAESSGHSLIVHTCGEENSKLKIQNSKLKPQHSDFGELNRAALGTRHWPWRKNFQPLLSREFPYYAELRLNLPPLLEILEWADRQQFDAVHVSTPGPMGLAGWVVAKMLRVPLVMTHHTDFPAYARHLTQDHRISDGATHYLKWFYSQAACVFSRSVAYQADLLDLGVPREKLRTISPGVDTDKFHPRHRDTRIWRRMNVDKQYKLLYAGRLSVEKNLPMLADIFARLCAARDDLALIVAGDGPYQIEMKSRLAGLPVFFTGYQSDAQLAQLYASSDLFIFPSRTDTLGQVVMEAQASALPAIVSNEGGPRELVDHEITGMVLPAANPERWSDVIAQLLDDSARRLAMSRAAREHCKRFSVENTFRTFWSEHETVAYRPSEVVRAEAPVAANRVDA
jgi:glycosyltransferase involved in cell wall biosynthesis